MKKIKEENATTVLQTKRALEILSILKSESDEKHPIKTNELFSYLQENDLDISEKTFSRILNTLYITLDNKENLNKIVSPNIKKGGKNITSIYYKHEFNENEMNTIYDGILFSTTIGDREKNKLIKKLKTISSKYYKEHNIVSNADLDEEHIIERADVWHNIEILEKNIAGGYAISFSLCHYDYNLHKNPYQQYNNISPFGIIGYEGKYYVVCGVKEKKAPFIFRIDLLLNIKTEYNENHKLKKAKPYKIFDTKHDKYDGKRFLKEHFSMYYKNPIEAELLVNKDSFIKIVDKFGSNYKYKGIFDDRALITVKGDTQALVDFAFQYSEVVSFYRPTKEIKDVINRKIKELQKY